jgi:RNA polymerase sigma factor (sigma-70 family)
MPGNDTTSLKKLVDGLIAGDDNSWREFLHMAGPIIVSGCRRAGLDRDETDDIAQKVVLKLLEYDCRSIRRLVITTDEAFFGWVKVIVSRTVLDHIRRSGFQRDRETSWAFDKWRDELDAQDVEGRTEKAVLLENAVKQLPDKDQALFWMDAEGLMGKEIARILGTNLNTVQQRLTRLRQKIRSILSSDIETKAEKT